MYDLFETNKEKEVKGVWIKKGVNPDGTIPEFLVATKYKTNKAYTKEVEQISIKFGDRIRSKRLSEEEAQELYLKAFCKACLLDWKNVPDKEDLKAYKAEKETNPKLDREIKKLPFNFENAVNLFMNDLPRLYDSIDFDAAAISTFQDEAREENAKN